MTADLRFYDNDRPPLQAADYRVTVTSQVSLPAPFVSPPDYVAVQSFQVSGPHFGLTADDVVSTYPPPGSLADRHADLAHVVLARPTLPWEIPLDPEAAASADVDPQQAEPLVAPWLAVVVVLPGEIDYPADAAVTGNLTGARVVPLGDYLAPGDGIAGPSFTPAQAARFETEYPDLQCTVVDLLGEAFDGIAPRSDELPFLAHTREVDTADQETDGATGWFSVVVGNRFPTASTTGVYVAHLVSLEGFADRLPDRATGPAPATVRLLSLHSWTFRSQDSRDNFDALMARLDVGVLRSPDSGGATGTPPAPEQVIVDDALAAGYTAMPYLTRLGEPTTAWYRGPWLPLEMERNRQPAYPAAEAALVYDPRTGMFDVSFAVAWQVGRLLALADRDFAVALLGWLRDVGSTATLLADRIALFRRFDLMDQPVTVAELLAPGAGRRAMVGAVSRTIAPALVGAPDRRGALGPALDPSGLLAHRHRTPGVVSPEEVRAASGATATGMPAGPSRVGGLERAVVELARSRVTGPTASVRRPAPGVLAAQGIPEVGAISREVPPGDPVTPRRTRVERVRRLLRNEIGASTVLAQAPPLPEEVGRWLGQLCLLEGVPFDHLVADSRWLPTESLRFFHVDANWLDALVDGALSIGAVGDPEAQALEVAHDRVTERARRHAGVERALRRSRVAEGAGARAARSVAAQPPVTAAEAADPTPCWTGFVLRSAVVADWPGLRVSATAADPDDVAPTLLRLDRPSPSVLVAIFDGVVGQVDLATPAQTLHFGAVDDAGRLEVRPRGLGDAFAVGAQLEVPAVAVPQRAGSQAAGRWVVDVATLVPALTASLAAAYSPNVAPPVEPGALGVELVATAECQRFVLPAPAGLADGARSARRRAPVPTRRAPAADTVRELEEGLARDGAEP